MRAGSITPTQAVAICRRESGHKPCYTARMKRWTRCAGCAVGLSQLGLAWSCAEPVELQRVEIRTAAMIGAEPAECGRVYSQWGKTFGLADARLYLSRIEMLRQESMAWEPLQLDENQWQSEGVALLDFENAQGACADFGTASVNTRLVGDLPEGNYIGLRFSVGLPHRQNHIDPATARGPLGEPGMFWTWQAGYKFVKVDVKVDGAPGNAPIRNNLHLGSTGCTSIAPMLAPELACSRPNLAQITLFPFDLRTQALELSLDELLLPALTQGHDRAPNCMGGPSEPAHCETIVRSFGLDPETGLCHHECVGQTLFGGGGL